MKDGKVLAQILEKPGGVERAAPLDYVKVVPNGLEFGRLNGIRPRGMMVYSGSLSGTTLSGEAQFRGILLPLPEGDTPPAIRFQLTRDKLE